jgi:hypothetical protein
MPAQWPLPTPGDIVWCRFPERPNRAPGPKPRPALVTEVTVREDGAEVAVAYGTSQRVDKLVAGEFAITRQGHAAAYKSAGLSHDTKFDFKPFARLPWSDDFFAFPPGAPHGQSPLLGALHASVMRAAAAANAAEKQR